MPVTTRLPAVGAYYTDGQRLFEVVEGAQRHGTMTFRDVKTGELSFPPLSRVYREFRLVIAEGA